MNHSLWVIDDDLQPIDGIHGPDFGQINLRNVIVRVSLTHCTFILIITVYISFPYFFNMPLSGQNSEILINKIHFIDLAKMSNSR